MNFSALKLPPEPTLTLTGTPAELKLLDRLQRYDVLCSKHLIYDMGAYGTDVLTRLYEAQAAGIPEYSRDWAIKRNVHYPVTVFPIGRRLLVLNGRWIGRAHSPDEFPHKYYRSTIEFLFDYGAQANGLTVKTLADVLAHEDCPPATQEDDFPHRLPLGIKNSKGKEMYVVPDSFRGCSIPLADTYFFIEADRDTEPYTSTNARQSIRQKLDHYDIVFDKGVVKSRYGFNQATVLWVTTDETRANGLLKQFKRSKYPKRHAVQVVPDFTEEIPPLTDTLVSQPWRRAEGGPFDILKVLRETAARKHGQTREGRSGSGAIEGD